MEVIGTERDREQTKHPEDRPDHRQETNAVEARLLVDVAALVTKVRVAPGEGGRGDRAIGSGKMHVAIVRHLGRCYRVDTIVPNVEKSWHRKFVWFNTIVATLFFYYGFIYPIDRGGDLEPPHQPGEIDPAGRGS